MAAGVLAPIIPSTFVPINVVNVPAAGVVPPIPHHQHVPALISAVVATSDAIVPNEVICVCAASTFKVTAPDVPPPDNPVPATTLEISPPKFAYVTFFKAEALNHHKSIKHLQRLVLYRVLIVLLLHYHSTSHQ